MERRDIWVTDADLARLRQLLEAARTGSARDREHLDPLAEELGRAHVVPASDIPPDVVTMHSRLRLRDLDAGKDMVFTLVFPSDADADQGKISVLAPLGTAVLGFRRGDTFEWHVPGRVRRLQVAEVLYQPEAAGDSTP